jgi:hypothetical protein
MTPDRTAEEVNEALQAKDEDWAFKLIVQARDQLAEMLENEDPAGDAWLLRSRPISDARNEALLAALIEHEFRQAQLPSDARVDEDRSPRKWLAERGIFISDRDLMTA